MTDVGEATAATVADLITRAGPSITGTGDRAGRRPPASLSIVDADRGRGVFSRVLRVTADWGDGPAGSHTVVVKLPADGPNGDAARASGAYRREALAYERLLPGSPVRHPRAHLVEVDGDGASFVLEDLAARRWVDQVGGMSGPDAVAVAAALRRFHDHWVDHADLGSLPIRRAVPASIPLPALLAGLATLDTVWGAEVGDDQRDAFARLVVGRDDLAVRFSAAGPVTLCHGDPRADNLAFDPDGVPVLFDWQQLAVQPGPADLAWLAATSLPPTVRRAVEADLVAAYGTTIDAYRLGLVLPGVAVLLLAQRHLVDERTRRFVATSLSRIGTALCDLDVGRR